MRSAPLTLSAPIAVTTTALNKSLVRITCRLGTRSTMTPPYSSSTSWVAVAIAKPAPSWAGVAPSEKNWKGRATPKTKLPNIETVWPVQSSRKSRCRSGSRMSGTFTRFVSVWECE